VDTEANCDAYGHDWQPVDCDECGSPECYVVCENCGEEERQCEFDQDSEASS
jgi:hypothetical protein